MRLKKFRNSLKKDDKFPYLVTDLINIKYLTGFTGTYARLIVDKKNSYFISDSRYAQYAESMLGKEYKFILQDREFSEIIKPLLKEIETKVLYVERHSLVLSEFLHLKSKLRGVKLMPGADELNLQRMVKDDIELSTLRRAGEITDNCVDHLIKFINPGMTEWNVAMEIEFFYRKNGCRSSSFDAIVASGQGSSMPHYETSMKKIIEKGDILLIDMGCLYKGYNSDLTRTFFVNSVDPELEKIYDIVKQAQLAAVNSAKPGMTTGKLDSVARDIIEKEEFGDCFGHSLGHGYGLEVHEQPAVKTDGQVRLKKNMTITIEPGIYVSGLGGVRIEDMILITSGGCEVLTKSSKEIIVI